jgi:hypothetical protein
LNSLKDLFFENNQVGLKRLREEEELKGEKRMKLKD